MKYICSPTLTQGHDIAPPLFTLIPLTRENARVAQCAYETLSYRVSGIALLENPILIVSLPLAYTTGAINVLEDHIGNTIYDLESISVFHLDIDPRFLIKEGARIQLYTDGHAFVMHAFQPWRRTALFHYSIFQEAL